MIPYSSQDVFHKADQKGVPIYDKCSANGPCFCTGKCRQIVGYITDPEKIKEYQDHIDKLNNLLRNRLQSINTLNQQGAARVYSWEIIQPKQLKED